MGHTSIEQLEEAEERFNDARLATVVHAGLHEYVPMTVAAAKAAGWAAIAAFRDPVTAPPEGWGKTTGLMWRTVVGTSLALSAIADMVNRDHPIEIPESPINADVPRDTPEVEQARVRQTSIPGLYLS